MAGKGFTVSKNWDNPAEHAMPAEARVPAEVRVGPVLVSPATVLAPMVGVTDTVFRRFIRHTSLYNREQGSGNRDQACADAAVGQEKSGCGLLMTEFTSADGLARMRESKRHRYLTFYEDEHPIGAQIFGANPETLAEAARIVEETGFDLVDLNLGCPAKRVVGSNGGSGLLRDLPRIGEIFRAVRQAVTIPFTAKFRLGWNDAEIVCLELARMAEAEGLNAVTLHARTREQGYSGQARWEWIARVKQAVNDSGYWQRRHSHAGGCGGHGGRNRLRCGDDWRGPRPSIHGSSARSRSTRPPAVTISPPTTTAIA
jgi:tRNA-dihydrouridine synthase B